MGSPPGTHPAARLRRALLRSLTHGSSSAGRFARFRVPSAPTAGTPHVLRSTNTAANQQTNKRDAAHERKSIAGKARMAHACQEAAGSTHGATNTRSQLRTFATHANTDTLANVALGELILGVAWRILRRIVRPLSSAAQGNVQPIMSNMQRAAHNMQRVHAREQNAGMQHAGCDAQAATRSIRLRAETSPCASLLCVPRT